MKNDNQKNEKSLEEINSALIVENKKETSNSSSFFPSIKADNESVSMEENKKEESKNKNIIKKLLDKINNFIKNNKDKKIIFECPNQNCPFIPFIKYFEFTESVATKCRMGHEYHLSLMNYFEIIFKKMNNVNFCAMCLKKNYSNIKSTSEFFCFKCLSYLCRKCQMLHNHNTVMELSKVNIYCPIHADLNTKFSGYCSNCQKDLCIHCLKDHSGEHHFLLKYLEIIPPKDKINNYKSQITKEKNYIEYVKNFLFEKKVIENKNEKNIVEEFCDNLLLKYIFYEIQLQTFDKVRFNLNIIKNVVDLFLIPQKIFQNLYSFISNLNEYNKTQISNKIISTILKYQNIIKTKKNQNLKKIPKAINKNLSHFEFKPLFSLNKNKNIKFIYLLKCGKILVCVENDGLYLYDDGTFAELLHIISETEIIDLCEDDSGLLFLLKKSMIEIIQIKENYNEYISQNKILFKTIDKVNFICALINRSIIVSRVKRNEGNLEIWMKSKIKSMNNPNSNNNNNNNNSKDKKSKNKTINNLPERGRNFINMFKNNNRRLEIVLRRTINNRNINNNINNINNFNNNIIACNII